MKIATLEILELKIPFRFTFKHALAARSEGHGVLVRTTSDTGHAGYGECVPRSYVTGETPESVIATLKQDLGAHFLRNSFQDFEDVVAALADRLDTVPRDQLAAFCTLELSLLDLAGRVFGRSAGAALGPEVRDEVYYSGVVSADSLEASLKALEGMKKFGFANVKLKVGLSKTFDEELIRMARETLGPKIGLRIDANCAWTAEEALRSIEHLQRFDIESVEQPVKGEDIAGLAWLTPRSPVPIMVDESLASFEDAQELIARHACHAFNLRVSKCGGLINSQRIQRLAQKNGIRCQVGAQVGETALLSAAGRLLATRIPDLLFAEGSFGTLLLESDIGQTDLRFGPRGHAPALLGLGLSVEVDENVLRKHTVRAFNLE